MVFGGLIKSFVSVVFPFDFTVTMFLMMFGVSGFYMFNGYPLKFSKDYFALLLMLFACLVIQIFSLIYTISPFYSYVKLGTQVFLNIGAFVVTYYLVSQKLVRLQHLKWNFFILGTIMAVFVFFLAAISGNNIQPFLQFLAAQDKRFEGFGFLDYLSFGTFLVSAILIDIESPKRWKYLFFGSFFLANLLLAGRAPTVLFIGVFLIHILWRWSVRKMAFLIPIIVAGAVALVFSGAADQMINRVLYLKEDATLGGRNELFTQAFQLISEAPLTGVGIGGFAVATEGQDSFSYPHNILLEVGAETGLVAAGAMTFFFLYGIGFLSIKVVNNSDSYPIYLAILYVFLNGMKSGCIADLRILLFWMALLLAILYLAEEKSVQLTDQSRTYGTLPNS